MNLYQFFYQYFIYPVIGYQYQYNIYNTFLYGLLFVIGFILFYYLFVKNKKVIIDKYFLFDLIILTLIFIIPRVNMDLGFTIKTYLLFTPLLELWILISFLPVLFLYKYRKYYLYILLAILILEIPFFIFGRPINLLPFLIFILLFSLLFYLSYKEKLFYLSIFGEIYEIIFSIISIYYFNLQSEHQLLNILIFQYGNPLLFYGLKLSLTLFIALYTKYYLNEDLANVIYIMLFYLGFLPGLRASLIDILI
jgi:hypothetical protein